MLVGRVYNAGMKANKKIALAVGTLLIVGSGVALAVSQPTVPKSEVKTEATEQTTPAATTPTTETAATPEPTQTTTNQTTSEPDPTPAPKTVVSKKVRWIESTGDVEPNTSWFFVCDTTWSDGSVTSKSLGNIMTELGPDGTPINKMTCPRT